VLSLLSPSLWLDSTEVIAKCPQSGHSKVLFRSLSLSFPVVIFLLEYLQCACSKKIKSFCDVICNKLLHYGKCKKKQMKLWCHLIWDFLQKFANESYASYASNSCTLELPPSHTSEHYNTHSSELLLLLQLIWLIPVLAPPMPTHMLVATMTIVAIVSFKHIGYGICCYSHYTK
jgi:hypothetical protein